MTHRGPGVVSLRDWLTRHPYLFPLLILIAGGAFRFYNLNWDDGLQLHPDERWIYMVVSGANGNPPLSWPTSWTQFLAVKDPTGGSPLNPHFFAYGTMPFYLLALVAGGISILGQHISFLSPWAMVNTYGGLPMLGRALSGLLDLASLLVLFAIGRRVFGYWTAVLAMALSAFTVLDIQLSHFYTVDTVLLPLILLTILAAVEIALHNRRAAYVWGGIALGVALATKTTALVLVAPLGAAGVLNAWYASPWPARGRVGERLGRHYAAIAERLNANLQAILITFIVSALTFVICEPYAVLDRARLVADLSQQTTFLVTNNPPFAVPFTIQYAHDMPYVYQIANMLFWTMGLPLALAGFAGVVFWLFRNTWVRMRADQMVLLVWVIPYFLFVGAFFAKFNRYMLPIMPIITLFGAALLVWLVRRTYGSLRLLAWSAVLVVTGVSFLYSLAYMNIYEHANTRVAASRWIYAHIPAGTTIATEGAWDDPLPMPVDGHSAIIYHQAGLDPTNPGLNLYDPAGPQKIANISNVLTHAQYIIMSSERMIGSIPKLPDRYPIAIRYYHLLFGDRLNFRLVKVFQGHPQLGPIVVHDYPADESFHVYDHPIVRIFKRVAPISAAQVASLLRGAPGSGVASAPVPRPATLQPDRRLMLTAGQWRKDASGPTYDQMFPPAGLAMQHPILTWLLALELLGLLAFPFAFIVFANLLDRGFVIAKTLGLLLGGYLVWILVSLHVALYDRTLIWLALAGLAILSALVAFVLRAQLGAFVRAEWRRLLTAEAVFLAGFAIFILLRLWYPDLGHQFSPVALANDGGGRMGEKQMELAFINAIARSRVFPPYDPFFSHGYINYYYYGFYLVATLCKLTQIAPATGFNLAIATFFAMLVGNVYSVVNTLTRRVFPGLLAVLFVGLIGNLNGAWQFVSGVMSVATVHSATPLLGGARDIASGLQQVLFNHAVLPPFDFWGPTRIVPPVGAVISEFPYFTYLFADLHPHLISYPMTAAALGLAVSVLLGVPRRLWQVGLSVLLGAVLLGALVVTNPWDFPTYLVVLFIGALVGAYTLTRPFRLRTLARPVLWTGGIAALSAVLYLPFLRSYHTVFSTGVGLVRDITPQMLQPGVCPTGVSVCPQQVRDALITPLHIYLEHFGLFVFAVLSFLAFLLWRETGLGGRLRHLAQFGRFLVYYRDRLPKVRRAARVARRLRGPQTPVVDWSLLVGLAILVAGLLAVQDFLLAFLLGTAGLTLLVLERLARRLPAPQLFVLALLLVLLALSIGTQIVFVKDWLAGGPNFRMNTIFKFYNQAWVLYAVSAATALYYFMAGQIPERPDFGARVDGDGRDRGDGREIVEGSSGPMTEYRPARLIPQAEATLAMRYSTVVGTPEGPLPPEGPGVPFPPATERAVPATTRPLTAWRRAWRRPLGLLERRPLWSLCLALLVAASLVYTYAGTVARETYRATWLPENSVPLTLDGMAFMKVAYPGDYAGIQWLNAHVHGAKVIAEASSDAYYTWESRVSMFTGLPNILDGIHEAEQRYGDELDPTALCGNTSDPGTCLAKTHSRADDVNTLYNSPSIADARRVIHTYHVRFIFVGFAEQMCGPHQCYSRAGLAKFHQMVGHGLKVAFRAPAVVIQTGPATTVREPAVTIYKVTKR